MKFEMGLWINRTVDLIITGFFTILLQLIIWIFSVRLTEIISNDDPTLLSFYLRIGCNLDDTNNIGQTFLHIVSEKGYKRLLQRLLQHGTKAINMQDSTGNTPLHLAAMGGHQEIIEMLVRFGAEVNALNYYASVNRNRTPLDEAFWHHRIECVQVLRALGGKQNQHVDPIWFTFRPWNGLRMLTSEEKITILKVSQSGLQRSRIWHA